MASRQVGWAWPFAGPTIGGMFELTREVRFGIDVWRPPPGEGPVASNGHAGHPPLTGLGHFFVLAVTAQGPVDPRSSYLVNIKQIDTLVRRVAVPVVERHVRGGTFGQGGAVVIELLSLLGDGLPGRQITALDLALSPYLSLGALSREPDMARLTLRFEFSAAHRLHNPALSEAANIETFGKCNNPAGHGHNYEVAVTVRARPGPQGVVTDVAELQRVVDESVIDHFDHKHLNTQVPEFSPASQTGEPALNPSVENIAMVAFRRLKPRLGDRLAEVTVWETPKTWCRYSE